MAIKTPDAKAALDTITEQVRRVALRAFRERPGFSDDLDRFYAEEDETTAGVILDEFRPAELAVIDAAYWLGELFDNFDGGEATNAALRVGLALLEEMRYRARDLAEVAQRAVDVADRVIGSPRQRAVDDGIYRLARGYELLMKVLPIIHRAQARARGKRKLGSKRPIVQSIERLAGHLGYSFPLVLRGIDRLIQVRENSAEQTNDDQALLDLAESLDTPLVRFTLIDHCAKRVYYDQNHSISFARIRNIIAAAKKSAP